MTGPHNFLGGESFYDRLQHSPVIPPTPAAPVSYVSAAPLGPPLLSVAYPNLCTLSKSLLYLVPSLRAGGRVLVLPPIKRGDKWHLHTQLAEGIGSRIPERGPARFRTHPIARTHFDSPAPVLASRAPGTGKNALATVSNQNIFKPLLHFRLGPEVVNQPGVYELIPARATG